MTDINLTIINNFLTHEQCQRIIKYASPHLTRSTLMSNKPGEYIEMSSRSSHGTFIHRTTDSFFEDISTKISAVTNMPSSHQESFQFLKYDVNQEYKPHFDYFIKEYSNALSRGGQRVKTAMIYLNTPTLGGETYFPYLHQLVHAEEGKLVVWSNATLTGEPIVESMHGGMPVLNGVKYALPIWIRQEPFI